MHHWTFVDKFNAAINQNCQQEAIPLQLFVAEHTMIVFFFVDTGKNNCDTQIPISSVRKGIIVVSTL